MISFNLRASGDSMLKVFWAWVVLAAPVVMTCDFWPSAITKVIPLWNIEKLHQTLVAFDL